MLLTAHTVPLVSNSPASQRVYEHEVTTTWPPSLHSPISNPHPLYQEPDCLFHHANAAVLALPSYVIHHYQILVVTDVFATAKASFE